MNPLINIENLTICAGSSVIIENVTLHLEQGETLTLLGETGAGKSLLAQAIMGDVPSALEVTGTIIVNGVDMLNTDKHDCEKMWGRDIVMLPQEPWHSLSPMMTIGQQVAEVFQFTRQRDKHTAQRDGHQKLANLGLHNDTHKVPSQLSGGMAQRVAFACASVTQAPLFIADEPTKGLDASRKSDIIAQLKQTAKQGTLLTITHDVTVAEALGGRCVVMKNGRIIETGHASTMISKPSTNYTQTLVTSAPQHWTEKMSTCEHFSPLVSIEGLGVSRGGKSVFSEVSFTLGKGEIVGLSGDSGSGKTSLGDALLGLLPYRGNIKFHHALSRHQKLKLYQDPPSAFAEHVPLSTLIHDVIKLHKVPKSQMSELASLLSLDSLLFERTASEVSGGELQRIALLRALLLKPKLLIADEPTSRLDPITSKKITHLLVERCREANCTVLFISHDIAQLEKTCDRIVQLGSLSHHSQKTDH